MAQCAKYFSAVASTKFLPQFDWEFVVNREEAVGTVPIRSMNSSRMDKYSERNYRELGGQHAKSLNWGFI